MKETWCSRRGPTLLLSVFSSSCAFFCSSFLLSWFSGQTGTEKLKPHHRHMEALHRAIVLMGTGAIDCFWVPLNYFSGWANGHRAYCQRIRLAYPCSVSKENLKRVQELSCDGYSDVRAETITYWWLDSFMVTYKLSNFQRVILTSNWSIKF